MTYQLKYRGISFTYQPSMPTEAVREVRFRGRTTVLSSAKAVAAPTKDVGLAVDRRWLDLATWTRESRTR